MLAAQLLAPTFTFANYVNIFNHNSIDNLYVVQGSGTVIPDISS
jgi:hypothetical protein